MKKSFLIFSIIVFYVIIGNQYFSQTSYLDKGCFCVGIYIVRDGKKEEREKIIRAVCDPKWVREDQAISSIRRSLQELSKETDEEYTVFPVAAMWCKD
jgi:hypothetical protein